MISRLLSIAVVLLPCAVGTGAAQTARPPSRSAAARDVASARAVYAQVEQAIAAKRLAPRDTTFACDGAPFDVDVTRHADASGRIRMLAVEEGSDDQSQTTRYYWLGRRRRVRAPPGDWRTVLLSTNLRPPPQTAWGK